MKSRRIAALIAIPIVFLLTAADCNGDGIDDKTGKPVVKTSTSSAPATRTVYVKDTGSRLPVAQAVGTWARRLKHVKLSMHDWSEAAGCPVQTCVVFGLKDLGDTDVVAQTQDSFFSNTTPVYRNTGFRKRSLSSYDKLLTATHELGHAIGERAHRDQSEQAVTCMVPHIRPKTSLVPDAKDLKIVDHP